MNEIARFRTALAGFNRNDVADYIQKSAAEHQAELQALHDENARLRATVAQTRQECEAKAAALAARQEQLEALRQRLLSVAAETGSLLSRVNDIVAEAAALSDSTEVTE